MCAFSLWRTSPYSVRVGPGDREISAKATDQKLKCAQLHTERCETRDNKADSKRV